MAALWDQPDGIPAMPLKAVLSEVDGSLVESVEPHAQAWVAAFRGSGQEIALDAMRAQIGKGGDQRMPVVLPPEARRDLRDRLSAPGARLPGGGGADAFHGLEHRRSSPRPRGRFGGDKGLRPEVS